MKQFIKYCLSITIVAFMLQSCELVANIASDDSSTTKVFDVNDAVKEISFNSDMEIELVESEENTITFSGAEALLKNLSIKEDNNSLTINCDKFASWSYAVPKVQLRLSSICKINLYAYNEMYASDTLRTPSITIFSDGTGDIKLLVNCQSLNVTGTLISNFYVGGKSDTLSVLTNYGSAFYGSGLIAQNVEANVSGSNTQIVYPVKSLVCNIKSAGTVCYVNKPENIEVNVFDDASGKAVLSPGQN